LNYALSAPIRSSSSSVVQESVEQSEVGHASGGDSGSYGRLFALLKII
jgi:hypothetical protein